VVTATFTFAGCEGYFREALDNGYRVITCEEYIAYKESGRTDKVWVNRLDVDISCRKAKRLATIFNALNIKGSFFIRLHLDEYNPFSVENYEYLAHIRDTGHEIGYHSDVLDISAAWDESAEECLRRDVAVLNMMFGIRVKGVASHRSIPGLNNLDFWKGRKAAEYGLLYEAYDQQPGFNLFRESFYVSDSNWTWWKCYDKGILRPGDTRTPGEHCRDGHQIMYTLIHPEMYYDEGCVNA